MNNENEKDSIKADMTDSMPENTDADGMDITPAAFTSVTEDRAANAGADSLPGEMSASPDKAPAPEEVEIIGVTFKSAGKIYYFDANGVRANETNNVIIDTARGCEYGKVALSNRMIPKDELVLPLRKVIRVADKNDDLRYKANCEKEDEAFRICVKKIIEHDLKMKLIEVEYTFDNAKLLFYFTSEERVDFRELVKDLASVFRTRIELRQIGLRDEAKIMGGFGICGREFCCHSFLGDFVQVSIKMAKEQSLSLNSAKISGACGRLMCCLRYEHETYQEEIKRTPKVDTRVITPDGPGVVTDTAPLTGTVKVRLDKDPQGPAVPYSRGILKNQDGILISPDPEDSGSNETDGYENDKATGEALHEVGERLAALSPSDRQGGSRQRAGVKPPDRRRTASPTAGENAQDGRAPADGQRSKDKGRSPARALNTPEAENNNGQSSKAVHQGKYPQRQPASAGQGRGVRPPQGNNGVERGVRPQRANTDIKAKKAEPTPYQDPDNITGIGVGKAPRVENPAKSNKMRRKPKYRSDKRDKGSGKPDASGKDQE